MAFSRVNAVIVGSGPGGGTVAKELAEAGLSVVLMERGKWLSFTDCGHDELGSQFGVMERPFGPDRRHPRVIDAGNSKRIIYSNQNGYHYTASCVGGGAFAYGALGWRFMPEDFKMKSTYGVPEGSSLEDWPISYEDLAPFYDKAEEEIGVAGNYSTAPQWPALHKQPPMPPHSLTTSGVLLKAAAHRLQWHPMPLPVIRNSEQYRGRPACLRCRWCSGYACEVNARGGSHNTVIPAALSTGNCELRINCMVAKVLTNEQGLATGIGYFDADERYQEQRADLVVLSASATESPRLLFNSSTRLFPNGLCNNNDWVGRNMQGHAGCRMFGLFEEDLDDDVGPGVDLAVADFCHHNPGIRGGGVLINEQGRIPYRFAMNRPPDAKRWGLAHKQFQKKWFRHWIPLGSPCQEMPVFDARVEVDPSVKDHWNIPVIRPSGRRHPDDAKVNDFIVEKGEAWLKEAGALEVWSGKAGTGVSGGVHQSGTCRMGDDPKTSVVNRWCQTHDIDNLFIVDASVHVTNAGLNPGLTVFTIGFWASDYIKRQWKSGAFRAGKG